MEKDEEQTQTRFLPFVSDRTSLKIIKEKLWASSKLIPYKYLLGMLIAISFKGVSNVRSEMSSNAGEYLIDDYKRIINTTSSAQIQKEVVDILQSLENSLEFESFEDGDIALKFVEYLKDPDNESLGVYKNFKHIFSETFAEKALTRNYFRETGVGYQVLSKADIYAYLFYHEYLKDPLSDEEIKPRKLIIIGNPDET